jgi:hypothetical protein
MLVEDAQDGLLGQRRDRGAISHLAFRAPVQSTQPTVFGS